MKLEFFLDKMKAAIIFVTTDSVFIIAIIVRTEIQ